MTFFIALFILVMQFLWNYVDDLVGKGLEVSVLLELLFYITLQVIPMALPLAILLASLMAFGNLGENYELTAIKSAGISLPRIMNPLIILTVIISMSAFMFSNNVLPVANLKLFSLLWSIRQATPEFDIKEKVFYNGLEGFSIKIEEKSKKGDNMLYDIMIYDQTDKLAKNTNVTIADSGKLQISKDKNFLKLTLYSGITYDEKLDPDQKGTIPKNKKQQFRVNKFSKQVAMIPLQGMAFNRYDEGLFKGNYKMKNLSQLIHDKDSLKESKKDYIKLLEPRVKNNYFSKNRMQNRVFNNKLDSLENKKAKFIFIKDYKPINVEEKFDNLKLNDKIMVLGSALRKAKDNKHRIDDRAQSLNYIDNEIIKHNVAWHIKFTLSFACLIFFFIGAPLGAIIRKGGIGLPIVISVLFFVIYYIIDSIGVKMSKEGLWRPFSGVWLSSMILFPIGVFLTYKATTDSPLLNADAYSVFFKKIKSFFVKNKYKKEEENNITSLADIKDLRDYQ